MARVRGWCTGRSLEWLIALHLTLVSVGVLGVFFGVRDTLILRYQSNLPQQAMDASRFFGWIRPYYFPEHKYTLFAFAIALCFIGAVFVLLLSVLARGAAERITDRAYFPWIYVADALSAVQMASLGLGGSLSPIYVAASGAIWAVIGCLPFQPYLSSLRIWRLIHWVARPKLIVLAFAIDFAARLLPIIVGPPIFLNDYFLEIPSRTWVESQPHGPEKLVDTLEYINSKRLWGHILHDPRVNPGEDSPCAAEYLLSRNPTPEQKLLVKAHRDEFYLRYPTNDLCVIGPMASNDILEGVGSIVSQENSAQLWETALANQATYAHWEEHPLSSEEISFVERNSLEIRQSFKEWEGIFHHQFQLLNPIKELSLNRPLREVVSLYGLTVVPIYEVMKHAGGINYQSFLTVVFSSYLAYFGLYLVILVVILQDWRYVAIVFSLSLAAVKALGYLILFVGVGYAPLRHFSDIFVIAFLYFYFQRSQWPWLASAIIAALAGLFLDRMYGVLVVAPLLGVLAVRALVGHSRPMEKWTLYGSLVLFPMTFWFVGSLTAPNPYANGLFEGVWGFPVSGAKVAAILIGSGLAYAGLANLIHKTRDLRLYLCVFLVFYAQTSLFYWLVIPNTDHLLSILPIIILAFGSIARFSLSTSSAGIWERRAVAIVFAASVALSALASYKFGATAAQIAKLDRTHQVFAWPFKNMEIRSTMDPSLFASSASMIDKWSSAPGIYVLSEFDTLLTWLSGHYSLMPHFDLMSYISGPVPLQDVIRLLKARKPEILFVDSCIECNYVAMRSGRESVLSISLSKDLYGRIAEKIDRLSRMQDAFRAIESDYELVERGPLISVYRRKGQAGGVDGQK